MSLEKFANLLMKSWSGSVCNLTVLGISAISFLGTNSYSSNAQTPRIVSQTVKSQQNTNQETNQANLLFVHPSIGNDNTGNGTENAPWQTITQALTKSNANTVIMLGSGRYSSNSGEVFPLILKPGVTIQGNIKNKGKSVIITGGGEYLSRSFGGQNVAIVANNQNNISGITVINNNSRGYGLWIESNDILVQENTFTQNTQDGIAVAGNGTANIINNYFYRNGANGITISGNARPEIRENVFQDTGFGINIAENAAPLVIGNQIQYNRSGVVVQANSTPVLRSNIIQNNKEDGLVVINQGRPDLGNSNDPGRNLFKSNKRYDINAKAAKLVVFASSNNLASNRIKGKVDLTGVNIARNDRTDRNRTEFYPQQNIENNPSMNAPVKQVSQVRNNRNSRQLPPLPDAVRNSSLKQESPLSNIQNDDHSGVIEFVAPQFNKPQLNKPQLNKNNQNFQELVNFNPVVKPAATVRKNPKNKKTRSLQSYQNPYPVVRNTPRVQNFVPYQNPYSVVRNTPRVQNFVPYQNPYPVVRNTPRVQNFVPYQNPYPAVRNTPKVQNFVPYGIGGQIPRYRVLVLINNQQQVSLLSDLAKDAFPRVWRGQQVIQIGVFSNSDNARSMVMNLANRGLEAVIEPVN